MMKIFLRIALVIVFVAILFLLGRNIWKKDEYVLSFQANRNIEVNGLEFMMTKEEVREILGMEDNYINGWGCYGFEYIKKGIKVNFLDDGTTSFYNKVNEIVVLNSNYKIYNVCVGMQYDKAIEVLKKQGLKKSDNEWYWKGNIYISLYKSNDQLVNKIMIGIKDRISSNLTY